MIQVEGLTFRYIGRKARALAGIDLRIEEGQTVLLLGPSGSGKSTLALCLNGLIPHSIGGQMEGRVCVAGLDSSEAPVSDLVQRVGVLFQDPEAQFVTMTVEDEIAFGLENLRVPPPEMDTRIEDALDQVGMAHCRRQRVDALSGGEKQRLALASLLAMRPRVLVLDEPTANLDPAGTRQVFETIARLKRAGRHTIVIIEHKLDDLMHLVDRVIALTSQGTVLADGTPQVVFDTQADVLLEHGVWMPQTALLAHGLRCRGIDLAPFPVTLSQAEQALLNVGACSRVAGHHPVAKADGPLPPAVEVRNLSFRYGKAVILHGINLRIPRGDFLAIVGANGAGKTTLAQHLIDVLHPPRGSVWLNGEDVTTLPASDLIRYVGYVFQNPEHQFIADSVAREVGFGLRLMRVPEAEVDRRVGDLLAQFGLLELARANPFTLSHGEKRRLSVATMLAVGQDTLILDEPTFGQDLRNAEALMQVLRDLHASGRTVVVITHDMSLVAEYAQHVAVMVEGRLLCYGTPADVFARHDVLAQARLTLPPLAELSDRMATHDARWPRLHTVRQYLEALTAVCAGEATF